MQVNSIEECYILQYFRPPLSYQLSLRLLFCLFLSGRFTQIFLYFIFLNGKFNLVGSKKKKDLVNNDELYYSLRPILMSFV